MELADRGPINGTRYGALNALRAFSILSSADLRHAFIALVPSQCSFVRLHRQGFALF